MIATEAALYGRSPASGSGNAGALPVLPVLTVCGCGQELGTTHRAHCPRCGCTLR